MDEYLDLVNENDEVIGRKLRSEVYAEHLSNFRVINAFVVNSKGELWIPRRTISKKIFPSCLDMSVAGHVESGEAYDDAFAREVMEEINVDVKKSSFKKIGYLTPKDGVSAFMTIYEIYMEEAPEYNKEDFVEYYWLKPEQYLSMQKKEGPGKSDLPIIVKKYYIR